MFSPSSSTTTRLASLVTRSFSTSSSLGMAAPSTGSTTTSGPVDMGRIAAHLKEQLNKGKVVEKEYYPLISPGIAPSLPPPRAIRTVGIQRSETKIMPPKLTVMGYPDILSTLPLTPLAHSLLSTLPSNAHLPDSPYYTPPTIATHLPSLPSSPSNTQPKYSASKRKATDAPYKPGKNKILSRTLVLGRDGQIVDISQRGRFLKPTREELKRRSLELVREVKGLVQKKGLDRKGNGEFEWLTEEEEAVRRAREMEGIF